MKNPVKEWPSISVLGGVCTGAVWLLYFQRGGYINEAKLAAEFSGACPLLGCTVLYYVGSVGAFAFGWIALRVFGWTIFKAEESLLGSFYKPVPSLSEFELLLIRSGNEAGTAVLLLLSWIAASDGSVDEKEVQKLRPICEASNHGHDIEPILKIVLSSDLQALQLAAEIVRRHFNEERAALFMQMAVGMAVADGYLTVSENHILRFLADLVGLTTDQLKRVFVEVTSKPLPEPSDPSTAEWWAAREQRQNNEEANRSRAPHSSKGSGERIRALAILGLEEEASLEEIKRAYRRLAQIHHPDRFVSLGKEAVATASFTFQRIKEAYDYLSSHA